MTIKVTKTVENIQLRIELTAVDLRDLPGRLRRCAMTLRNDVGAQADFECVLALADAFEKAAES